MIYVRQRRGAEKNPGRDFSADCEAVRRPVQETCTGLAPRLLQPYSFLCVKIKKVTLLYAKVTCSYYPDTGPYFSALKKSFRHFIPSS